MKKREKLKQIIAYNVMQAEKSNNNGFIENAIVTTKYGKTRNSRLKSENDADNRQQQQQQLLQRKNKRNKFEYQLLIMQYHVWRNETDPRNTVASGHI